MSLTRRIATAALALLALPGCASTVTVAAEPMCTPLPTLGPPQASATPCSSAEASANAATLALEQEAIKVYERYAAEYYRLHYEGGASEPTPVLAETTDGTLQKHVMLLLRYYKDHGLVAKGPAPTVRAAVDRTAHYADTEVTLLTCEDVRGSAMYYPDGIKQPNSDGRLQVAHMLLARRDGRLKIFTYSIQEVSSCPLG